MWRAVICPSIFALPASAHIAIYLFVNRYFAIIQWQAATGDFFAKLCAECEEKPAAEKNAGAGLSRENMDFDVHPKGECIILFICINYWGFVGTVCS